MNEWMPNVYNPYYNKIVQVVAVNDINDLAKVLQGLAEPILFADDTSIIVSNKDTQEFKNKLESVTNIAVNWFQNNLLSLNLEKKLSFYNF